MKNRLCRLYFTISLLGVLFVFTEFVLQLFGSRICETEGCELVAKQVRFGEWTILLLGFVTFLFLFFSNYIYSKKNITIWDNLNTYVLIIALACEGFFTGYQAFRLFAPCYFCLIVFTLIVILGLIKLIQGEKLIFVGFGSLIGIFLLFYLILPVNTVGKVPEEPLVLFYSKTCKHCEEIIKELDAKKIAIPHVLVDENPNFLKNVGISYVPVLFINLPSEKRFLIGTAKIRAYFFEEDRKIDKQKEKKGDEKETKTKKINKNPQGTPSLLDFNMKKSVLDLPSGACNEEVENCD